MKIETSELSGNALDWAVGVASGLNVRIISNRVVVGSVVNEIPDAYYYTPSTNWSIGGEIIARERIDICHHFVTGQVTAIVWFPKQFSMTGDASAVLVVAMRCYVASKLGEEVNVPDELITK